MKWDLFISHASEDKDDFVRPLAEKLIAKGFKVWYDEFTLKLGDKLLRSIEKGLAESRFGVVILSPYFFKKKWTKLELAGLVALEQQEENRILPVWYKIEENDVKSYSPSLADRVAVKTDGRLDHVVQEISKAVNRESDELVVGAHTLSTPSLHPNSIELLLAAQKADGLIYAVLQTGGFSVQAGDKLFGPPNDPRIKAINLHSLDELLKYGFVEGSKDIYVLTQKGFDYKVPEGVNQAPTPVFPTLTPDNEPYIKQIMKAAVADNGRVRLFFHTGGSTLRAGELMEESNGDRRKVARWKSVLDESYEKGLMRSKYNQDGCTSYLVSHLGYLWTDSLNLKEAES